jgi:hypothetical protein
MQLKTSEYLCVVVQQQKEGRRLVVERSSEENICTYETEVIT